MEFTVSAPLPVGGLSNTRDLGGYPLEGGGVTRSRMFLRGEAPVNLTEKALEELYAYGVRCVIDLRSHFEVARAPDSLRGYRDVAYFSFPLSDNVHDRPGGFPASMGEMYTGLLDSAGETLARVFRAMLEFPEDCVLFHCTAGKDRTGIIAMLLLKLAGADDGTVVEDYAATERNMPDWRELQGELSRVLKVEVPAHVFRSEPESMRKALEHLRSVYGGAEEYLRSIGLSGEELSLLRKKLRG